MVLEGRHCRQGVQADLQRKLLLKPRRVRAGMEGGWKVEEGGVIRQVLHHFYSNTPTLPRTQHLRR